MDSLFVWIPKTGGTSLWKMLSGEPISKMGDPVRGVTTFGHVDPSLIDFNGFRFCFVRNPYGRARSLYEWTKRTHGCESFLEFCRLLDDVEPIGDYNVKGLSQCNPQVHWIAGVDFIGRLESFERDVKALFRILGIHVPGIPHLRQSKSKPDYCKESKQIIEHIYREDFEALGYELI